MNPLSLRTTFGITATLLAAAGQSVNAASIDAPPGFFFSTLPFSDTGTTVGAVNDITSLPQSLVSAGNANFTLVAGPDVFYTFIVGSPGTLSFTLSPLGQSGYDTSIYLLTGGTTGTEALKGKDAAGFNAPETLTTGVLAPGTYYLVVDSFYSASEGAKSAGAFALSVNGDAVLVPEPCSSAMGLAALAATSWRRRRQGAR